MPSSAGHHASTKPYPSKTAFISHSQGFWRRELRVLPLLIILILVGKRVLAAATVPWHHRTSQLTCGASSSASAFPSDPTGSSGGKYTSIHAHWFGIPISNSRSARRYPSSLLQPRSHSYSYSTASLHEHRLSHRKLSSSRFPRPLQSSDRSFPSSPPPQDLLPKFDLSQLLRTQQQFSEALSQSIQNLSSTIRRDFGEELMSLAAAEEVIPPPPHVVLRRRPVIEGTGPLQIKSQTSGTNNKDQADSKGWNLSSSHPRNPQKGGPNGGGNDSFVFPPVPRYVLPNGGLLAPSSGANSHPKDKGAKPATATSAFSSLPTWDQLWDYLPSWLRTQTRFSTMKYFPPSIQSLKDPKDIRNVVVVGVHGWFPSWILQTVTGQVTGTSQRFSSYMFDAVQQHFRDYHGVSLCKDDVTVLSLEGEGKISRRVDNLYNQLIDGGSDDRLDALKNADLILFSAHSQGTPVSAMLIELLLDGKIINLNKQRVAFLGMAGINHGPIPYIKDTVFVRYLEAEPARELFDFNRHDSAISLAYNTSLMKILNAGVRMTAIGSWYDQVVPLYSAIAHGINHPNIYRGLFIHVADYAPDFLSHVAVFAIKLRNFGLSDHNLVLHLSEPLAGNILAQGHSLIYDDIKTYTMAVEWALGSTLWTPSVANPIHPSTFSAPSKLNSHYLPWIFSKLMNDPLIQSHEELRKDLDVLVQLYQSWDPQSKKDKELKHSLEPLRAHL